MKQELLSKLREILANFYPDADSIRRIVDDSGISHAKIHFGNNALNIWHSVLIEADKSRRLPALLDKVADEYKSNEEFNDICERLRQLTDQTDSSQNNKWDQIDENAQSSLGEVLIVLSLLLALVSLAILVLIHRLTGQWEPRKVILTWIDPGGIADLVEIAFYPSLVLGFLGMVWLTYATQWFKKLLDPLIDFILRQWHKDWQKIIISLLILVFLLLVFWISNLFDPPTPAISLCKNQENCIIINQLHPEFATDPGIVERINSEIFTAAKNNDISVYITNTVGIQSPFQLFETEKNILFITVEFSQVLRKEAKISYELNDAIGIGGSATARPFRVQPSFYQALNTNQDFKVITTILTDTQKLNFVAQAAVGLVAYAKGDSRSGSQVLQAVLNGLYGVNTQKNKQRSTCISPVNITNDEARSVREIDWIYYYLGKSLILQGSYETGIGYLEQVQPNDSATCISIALAYQEWQREHIPAYPDEGCELMKLSTLSFAMQVAVRSLCNAKKITEYQLENGKTSEEDKTLAYYHLGMIYEIWQKFAEARINYTIARDRFEKAHQNPYVTLLALGRVEDKAGRDLTAKTFLEEAIKIEPQLPWAYLELARLQKINNKREAQNRLQQAAKVAPTEVYVDITRAELCTEWAEYDCADKAYQAAKKKQPNSGWLLSKMGDFYMPGKKMAISNMKWEVAMENYYPVVTDLRTNDPWAHERYAYILTKLGDWPGVAKHYQIAVDLLAPIRGVPPQLCSNLAAALKRQPSPIIKDFGICLES